MKEPVKLIVLEGHPDDEHPTEVVVRSDSFLIGRSAACGLAIEHSRISMEHCCLERRPEGIWVNDLDSTFGTQVNGISVRSRQLHDGDLLQVGPVTILVAIGAAPSEIRRRVQARWEAERSADTAEMLTTRGGRDPNDDTPAVQTARRIFENLATRSESTRDREHHHAPGDEDSADELAPVPDIDDPVARALGPGHKRRWYLKARRDERGIVVVELLDRSILHDSEIAQIDHEINELVNQGMNRMILDFGNVHHLSSQALGIIIQFQKRCKAAGGLLKVCNPNPQVAEIFKIANFMRVVEVFAEEAKALASDWPEPVATSPTSEPSKVATAPAAASGRPSLAEALDKLAIPPPVVRLILEVGKSKGKLIPINNPRFVIGRDPRCQLRPASEAISRIHTRIDQRDGRVFVRDMGTTNGTQLGDRLLQGEEAEAHDGDRLTIGPLVFTLSITPASLAPATSSSSRTDAAEDAAASWLLEPGEEPKPGDTSQFPLIDTKPTAASAARAEFKRLKTQVVGDVLLISIQSAELIDEEQISPIRRELLASLDPSLPHKVVIRLDRVGALSSLAVAMLMSHFQRLDRLGGSLRLSNVRDEVFPALENLIAAGAIAVYPKAEQALQDAWPIT